jgi:glutathione synthase/RimK-type ligase-like ATP-grasp enzyme
MNALHDGAVINCPITLQEEGKVYQVLIDNSYDEHFVIDYRVPVIAGRIPHVYRKFKIYSVRFTNEVTKSDIGQTADFFSQEEQTLLVRFAQAMGADFCELDVLRNNSDKKIYVIDVNKTPFGPPFGLSQESTNLAINNLTKAIQDSAKERPLL